MKVHNAQLLSDLKKGLEEILEVFRFPLHSFFVFSYWWLSGGQRILVLNMCNMTTNLGLVQWLDLHIYSGIIANMNSKIRSIRVLTETLPLQTNGYKSSAPTVFGQGGIRLFQLINVKWKNEKCYRLLSCKRKLHGAINTVLIGVDNRNIENLVFPNSPINK